MSLDTISLSDIGKTLCEIEAEIKSNISSIEYHTTAANDYREKNRSLKALAKELLLRANPNIWKEI